MQLISQETIDYLKAWSFDIKLDDNVRFVFYSKLIRRIKLFLGFYWDGTCSSSSNDYHLHSSIHF